MVSQIPSTIYYEAQSLSIDELIEEKAIEYQVSNTLMRQIIACESSWNPEAIGDNGNSYGLVQIHLPSHPAVTKEQAFDPEFAVDFLAKNLEKNHWWWTCYKIVSKIDGGQITQEGV